MRASIDAMDRHREHGKSGRPRLSREDALLRVLVWIEPRECAPLGLEHTVANARLDKAAKEVRFLEGTPGNDPTPARRLERRQMELVRLLREAGARE